MPKDDIVRVRHATDAARKALSFVKDRCREDLDSDEMLALSLIRLLEVIGEAAIGISNEIRESHPDVPWNKMGYLGIKTLVSLLGKGNSFDRFNILQTNILEGASVTAPPK